MKASASAGPDKYEALVGVFRDLPPSEIIPPKIPPKPPMVKRKQLAVLEFSAKNNDYANCIVSREGPAVEREIKPNPLPPKQSNPSMPNLGAYFATEASMEKSKKNSSNPFSPEVAASKNPFLPADISTCGQPAKSPYRLGEEFFHSLFREQKTASPATGAGERKHSVRKKKSVSFSDESVGCGGGGGSAVDDCDCDNSRVIGVHYNERAITHRVSARARATNSPISDPARGASGGGAAAAAKDLASAVSKQDQDKYAALKDLDDIFRTSVTINDGEEI